MGFNLDDYEPVAARIDRFWHDHPNGRIKTTLEPSPDGIYRILTRVWRDATTKRCDATGWAEETLKSVGRNMESSILEVTETSSVGRALANLGYQTKKAGAGGTEIVRPSREEMMAAANAKAAEQRARLASATPRPVK